MRVTATPPIVEARGVHKYFGALHVLKGVDLVVQEKELVFVIGPSGSGKSTLLRCLNRLEDPTEGSITVDGIDMLDRRTDINKARQRIGMVFQSFNLYPHMTALQNVMSGPVIVKKMGKAEAETLARDENAVFVDLELERERAVDLVHDLRDVNSGQVSLTDFAATVDPLDLQRRTHGDVVDHF